MKRGKAIIIGIFLIAVMALQSCTERSEPPIEGEEINIMNEQSINITADEENKFIVSGTKILDPDGKEYLIKGVNVNGPGWVFPRDTMQDLTLITDIWQFNTVRMCAAIGWEWAMENNKDLDALIKAFTDKKIVVILEVHDYTGIFPPQDETGYRAESSKYIYPLSTLKEWWADKAERFKNNLYVWFNIMNEPGDSDTGKETAELWAEIHSEVIEVIRNAGAENIIVLDDYAWGQAKGYTGGASSYDSAVISMGADLNEKYSNLVYSLHIYDAWRDGSQRFEQYFSDAEERGLCVILGEFGVGTDNLSHHNAVKSMYNSAIPRNIGRIYWAWDDGGLPLTTSGGGWTIDKVDGAMPNNLTWAGQMVWLDNRGELTAPVPDYSLTVPLLTNGDFENGTPGGWTNWGGSSIEEGASYNGSKALMVSSDASGGAGCPLDLKPNTTYKFSVWGKTGKTSKSLSDVGVKYKLSPNASSEEHKFVSFTSDEWEQKSITFTTPNEIYGTTFFIWKSDADVALYLDDLELIEVSDN